MLPELCVRVLSQQLSQCKDDLQCFVLVSYSTLANSRILPRGVKYGVGTRARGRDDLCPVLHFAAVRLPMPIAAEVRVRVGVRAPKRPSATSSFFKFLRAGAKLGEGRQKVWQF